ncbi:MAG: hypothetical protein IKW79_06995 [Schwartzia sp.]|nr:hypothetical protein [Schwartzia sp. (in: firmicutes)]
MKKMMLAAMAAMVIGSAGTAMAATPERGYCRDNAKAIETSYAYCGDGYHGRGRGGRGGYGCDGYGYGHRGGNGGGYCYDNRNDDSEG